MLKITRAPDFSRSKERELNSSGQYSNNAVWIPVQRHSLIDYARIAAEPRMPERVTDYDHRLARGLSFIRLEETAKLRLDSQHIEKIRRHSRRWYLQRLALPCEIEVVIRRCHHAGKRLAMVMHAVKAVQ